MGTVRDSRKDRRLRSTEISIKYRKVKKFLRNSSNVSSIRHAMLCRKHGSIYARSLYDEKKEDIISTVITDVATVFGVASGANTITSANTTCNEVTRTRIDDLDPTYCSGSLLLAVGCRSTRRFACEPAILGRRGLIAPTGRCPPFFVCDLTSLNLTTIFRKPRLAPSRSRGEPVS